MAIRYFHIKSKPDVQGFAIKVDTENSHKKIEDLSADHSFNKIRENKKYAHFELIEEDSYILRDNIGSMGTHPVKIAEGSKKPITKICLNSLGNLKLYDNKQNYLFKEISKIKAEKLQEEASNWRIMQSWI